VFPVLGQQYNETMGGEKSSEEALFIFLSMTDGLETMRTGRAEAAATCVEAG
jgi:hypothetical protein